MNHVTINGREIGPAHPPYVIAELSANHNGRIERALEIMEAAKDCGADAVKLQTYTADTMTLDHDSDDFRITGGLWDGYRLYDLYQEAHTPWEWHPDLFAKAAELELTVFSTPFDPTAVAFLDELSAPAFKIASFELTDLPLISKAAACGKPLIMSTGLANLGEIEQAVQTARAAGCDQILLLHCVSSYPAPAADSHLRTMPNIGETFGLPVGLSDHTEGTAVAVAAVALGACAVEKHFTLRRSDGGPDSAFSLEPPELRQLVRDCRMAWDALGRVHYDTKGSESGNVRFRRSLYATANIGKGDCFGPENVRSIRPGFGLPPKHLPDILGKRTRKDIARGSPLTWDMVEF